MIDKDKLKRVIDLALSKGFVPTESGESSGLYEFSYWLSGGVAFAAYHWAGKKNNRHQVVDYHVSYSFHKLIFDHNFAKALYGETDEWHDTKCTCGGAIHPLMDLHHDGCNKLTASRGYKFHLKEMVVADNPWQYLDTTLDDNAK